jgi:hypothetical protein
MRLPRANQASRSSAVSQRGSAGVSIPPSYRFKHEVTLRAVSLAHLSKQA